MEKQKYKYIRMHFQDDTKNFTDLVDRVNKWVAKGNIDVVNYEYSQRQAINPANGRHFLTDVIVIIFRT